MNTYLLIYFIIVGVFGWWYSDKFIFAYMKKHNIPHPRTMPNKMMIMKQALVLTLYQMIAWIVAGLLWPLCLIEVIKNKGVRL